MIPRLQTPTFLGDQYIVLYYSAMAMLLQKIRVCYWYHFETHRQGKRRRCNTFGACVTLYFPTPSIRSLTSAEEYFGLYSYRHWKTTWQHLKKKTKQATGLMKSKPECCCLMLSGSLLVIAYKCLL